MARDLFGDVSTPSVKLGSQAWYTVPLSIMVHIIVCAIVIVVPFASSGLLPMPEPVIVFAAPPPLPEAPLPPAPATRTVNMTGPVSRSSSIAPAHAPSSIEPETGVPSTFPAGGVVGGIGHLGDSLGAGLVNVPSPPPPPQVRVQEPVRPGGHIKPPAKVRHVAPVYPRIAQDARVEGVVILEAIIAIDGRVQQVRVLRSKPLLDQAAIDAVRQWLFTPTLLNGVPVPVIMTVTVNFGLER
jgi:protein TonB